MTDEYNRKPSQKPVRIIHRRSVRNKGSLVKIKPGSCTGKQAVAKSVRASQGQS